MLIVKEKLLSLFIEAAPSFEEQWQKYLAAHPSEDRGVYNDVSEFVRYLVEQLRHEEKSEFPDVFEVAERVLKEGDKETREIIVIGFFEDLQTIAENEGIDPNDFSPYMGSLSKVWWNKLKDFWGRSDKIELD